jgi:hypothetical protein
MKLPRLLLSTLLLFVLACGHAQTTANTSTLPLLQISGVVLDQDSLSPIPYVSVIVKDSKRGTVSDYYGFFSIVVYPGDVLEFSSMTHKSRSYKVADSTRSKYHSIIQVLNKDTMDLPMVDVFPWPSKEDFKRAFLALDLSDSDAERADRNLEREDLSYAERTQPANARENYRYVMQQYYTKVYTSGQSAQNNLMNPIKWAQFINAWKSGKLSATKPYKKKTTN